MDNKQKDIVTLELTVEEVALMEEQLKHDMSEWLSAKISMEVGTRKNQEDSAYMTINQENHTALAIVCDGMGGLRGGEIASDTAINIMVKEFEMYDKSSDNYYYYFKEAIQKADKAVSELKDENGIFLESGTTMVAVTLKNDRLQWLSVGDSKIFVIRGKDIVSVAKEHTYINLLNDQYQIGAISDEIYEREKRRGEALTSYVGMGNVEMMELNYEPLLLQKGDIILLCSDGLYKGLPEKEIGDIVYQYADDLSKLSDELQNRVRQACFRSQDNTTIILLKYDQ